MRPIVSVCIANYNGVQFISGCIASVLAQDCSFSVEIIVHDDASTDGSVQHIRDRYPQVMLLESAENVGFCVANNRMAQAAEGEYLLLLNNDAELYPDALSTLFKEAQNGFKPAILSLPQYDFDTGELLDIGCLVDPFLNPVPNLDSERHDVAMVMGACLWIPRALWQKFGGFPEWFGSIAEDLYLCFRARLAGYSVRALGISGYRHRVGGSFGGGKVQQGRLTTTRRRRALSERNKTFVMIMSIPGICPLFLLPLHLFILCLEGMSVAIVLRDPSLFFDIYASVFTGLIRNRRRLWQQRCMLQEHRRIPVSIFFAPFTIWPRKLQMLLRYGLPRVC